MKTSALIAALGLTAFTLAAWPAHAATLAECGSPAVNQVLINLANQRGATVYNVNSWETGGFGNAMRNCSGYAMTSAGRYAISYTVAMTNFYTGQFWVHLNYLRF